MLRKLGLLFFAILLALPTATWAQSEASEPLGGSTGGRASRQMALLMKRQKQLRMNSSMKPLPRHRVSRASSATVPADIYGCLASSWGWLNGSTYTPRYGINRFTTASGNMQEVFTDPSLDINFGGVWANGKFYGVHNDASTMTSYLVVYDTEYWRQLRLEPLNNTVLYASDLTYDPTTGNIYGCFFSFDSNNNFSYVLGIPDYDAKTVNIIGPLGAADGDKVNALAVDANGQLWGLCADHSLYKINKQTAEKQLVGPTQLPFDGSYFSSGDINPRDGKLYAALVNTDQTTSLYSVDLTTGQGTEVYQFPNREQLGGITIPAPAADDDAPGQVTIGNATFANGSLSGTVELTLPTTTYAGAALQDSVSYTIVSDSAVVGSGRALAGATVQASVTLQHGGQTRLYAYASNGRGNGPRSHTDLWVGPDEPEAVAHPTLAINGTTATLHWGAPTKGVHGGYVDPSALTYDVLRQPGNVKLGRNLTDTTFTEQLTLGTVVEYYYNVVPKNGELTGDTAKSNSVVAGNGNSVPYFEGFDTESSLNVFKIIDANNDGKTWGFYDSYYSQSASCDYSDVPSDDWLLTPEIILQTGYEYQFSFDYSGGMSDFEERLAVAWGEGDDPSTYTDLVPAFTFKTGDFHKKTVTITVDHNGRYRFGFHALSDANKLRVKVDSISVTRGMSLQAPDSTQTLSVVPSPTGNNSATISFTVPDHTIGGEPLTSLNRVVLMRDGQNIFTKSNPTPGESIAQADNTTAGNHTYSLVAENAAGLGRQRSVTAWIGYDVPSEPATVRLADNNDGTLTLSWSPTTQGKHGGYFQSRDVTYNVYDSQRNAVATGLTRTSMQMDASDFNSGDPRLVSYAVMAVTSHGQSQLRTSNALLGGAPYTLPFSESFAGGKPSNYWWLTHNDASQFEVTEWSGVDYEDGYVSWTPSKENDESSLNSAKIALRGASNPVLSFWLNFAGSDNLVLDVLAESPVGIDTVCTVNYDTVQSYGWQQMSVPLSTFSRLASQPYFVLKFRGHTIGEATGRIDIDEIELRNIIDHDLAATLSVPATITAGRPSQVKMRVYNNGTLDATGYTVSLYADGKLVEAISDTATLAHDASANYTVSYTPSVLSGDSTTLEMRIDYAADLDAANDSAATRVAVAPSDYPAPTSLVATPAAKGTVSLTWDAVTVPAPKATTEDFESYDANQNWSNGQYGPWLGYDRDGLSSYEMTGLDLPDYLVGQPTGWVTFNPTVQGLDMGYYPELVAHSGQQYLVSIAGVPDGDVRANNDWLISPELSGEAQTITFYAKSYQSYDETLQVYYSTSGTDFSDFTPVGDAHTFNDNTTWEQVSVALPAGAKHFVIAGTSPDAMMLLLDDISYVPAALQLEGYRVYRDSVLIDSVAADATGYDDANATEGTHTYQVSAVYNEGESSLSVPATVSTATAISSIEAGQMRSEQGSLVFGGSGNVSVYTLDGRTVYAGRVAAGSRVSVPAGQYLVRFNNRTVNLIVR